MAFSFNLVSDSVNNMPLVWYLLTTGKIVFETIFLSNSF